MLDLSSIYGDLLSKNQLQMQQGGQLGSLQDPNLMRIMASRAPMNAPTQPSVGMPQQPDFSNPQAMHQKMMQNRAQMPMQSSQAPMQSGMRRSMMNFGGVQQPQVPQQGMQRPQRMQGMGPRFRMMKDQNAPQA